MGIINLELAKGVRFNRRSIKTKSVKKRQAVFRLALQRHRNPHREDKDFGSGAAEYHTVVGTVKGFRGCWREVVPGLVTDTPAVGTRALWTPHLPAGARANLKEASQLMAEEATTCTKLLVVVVPVYSAGGSEFVMATEARK